MKLTSPDHLIMEANFVILKLPNINTQALSMIYGMSSPVGWRKMENPMEMAYSYRAMLNKLKVTYQKKMVR